MRSVIKRLDWDSDFFGIEVGEWTDQGTPEGIEKFDLIYQKLQDSDVSLPGFTCTFQEQKILFSKKLETAAMDPAIEVFGNRPASDLYELAYESGKHSRFKLDPRFKSGSFEELYRMWVDNSVNGKFADGVLVYQSDNNIAGFVTYKIMDRIGNIGLIAVSPDFQGQGIGKKLVLAVESSLLESGIDELRIPTQESNTQACDFYTNLGYSILNSTQIKHFWK